MPSLISRIRFANFAISALILLLIGGAIGLDRQREIDVAYRNVNNLADALSLQVKNDFTRIDDALRYVKDTIDTDRLEDEVTYLRIYQVLGATAQGLPSTFSLFIIGPDGQTLNTSRMPRSERIDMTDRAVFTAVRDDPNVGLFIEPPVRARAAQLRGQWIVNAGRRLERSDGSFAGVIAAAISLDQMQETFLPFDLGKEGVVTLFRADGIYILRHPQLVDLLGQSIAGGRLFQERLKESPSGSYEGLFPSDGITRFSAYRTITDLPLVTLVGLSKKEVLSDWWLRATFATALALALVGMVIAFSEFLKSTVRREQAQDKQRLATLRGLADASIELLAVENVQALVARATEQARTLIPSHKCATSLASNGDMAYVLSCSDKYAEWRNVAFENAPARGLHRVVRERNQPLRLSRAELDRQPWKDFNPKDQQYPPLQGWLGAPLISQSGRNLGVIGLSDREHNEFSAEDEAILVQMASLVSVCIENAQLLQGTRVAAANAQESQQEIENVLSSISDAFYVLDNDFNFTYLNDRALELIKRKRDDLMGKCVWDEFPEAKETIVYELYHRCVATGESGACELYYEPLRSWFAVRIFPHAKGLSVYFRDISDQVETEEKLQQAEKLKAVGQLTGGVAHDFNNLLTVILGNADILTDELRNNRNLLPLAEMTRSAAERAAELTKRLLAFARRQPLNPKTVDVNKLVSGFETLLRRTLGEQIAIELVQGAGLWKAQIDPSQLESALLNLAINSRDAMSSGGRLTIETTNAHIDDNYASQHEEVLPGQYVLIAVSDTGEGIPKDLINRVFEPFFTTKEVGKGSGLGLSMIYGFIKQSGGHVKIYSEPDEGTTVKLYLPRARDESQVANLDNPATVEPPHGKETILLVEDDDMVRSHVRNQLIELGYTVVDAADAAEAITLFETTPHIDLLFTDIVMPGGLNGRKLADQLRARSPELKVLFMSGYTENAIVHHGRLDPGVFLLNKPFRKQDLARKVRQVFESEP
jgi:PAS domain S-box-containing protein